jgi:hypothetical protein
VSTSPPSEQNEKMAQFDSLIIFPLIWSLLIALFIHYNILFESIIPNFFGVKKFREKKLDFSGISLDSNTLDTKNAYNLSL